MSDLLLARLETQARPARPARREVLAGQGRLVLQAIVDPPAQLGARGSRGIKVKEGMLASKVCKGRLVRKGFQGFQGFQVPL